MSEEKKQELKEYHKRRYQEAKESKNNNLRLADLNNYLNIAYMLKIN